MKKLNKLTLGAMVAAIIIALFYFATFVQTGTVAIYYVISLSLMVLVVEAGIRSAAVCYAVTAVLLGILAPDKGMAIGYAMFFGLFPVIKAFFERTDKLFFHYIFKLVFFVIVTFVGMGVFSAFVASFNPAYKIGIGIGAVFAMFAYDYLLTLGITYYGKYLAQRIFPTRKP